MERNAVAVVLENNVSKLRMETFIACILYHLLRLRVCWFYLIRGTFLYVEFFLFNSEYLFAKFVNKCSALPIYLLT